MNSFTGKYYVYGNNTIALKEKNNSNTTEEYWQKCQYSVVSVGTELWQLIQSESSFNAGYIAIGKDDNYIISPTPHGSSFNKSNVSNLSTNTDIDIYQLSVARFQLMSAAAISSSTISKHFFAKVSIIGSGAVAIATAIEFLRQNYQVKIFTKRMNTVKPLLNFLTAQIVDMNSCLLDELVIDCVGTEDSIRYIINNSVSATTVGILGSPRSTFKVDMYQIHRKGLNVVGLHELNCSAVNRQAIFEAICRWHQTSLTIPSSLFHMLEGEKFKEAMYSLQTCRPLEPFLIFRW